MEITKDILEKLIWEDCDSRQKWMKVWTAIVGDALEKEEGPWELLYSLLFLPSRTSAAAGFFCPRPSPVSEARPRRRSLTP